MNRQDDDNPQPSSSSPTSGGDLGDFDTSSPAGPMDPPMDDTPVDEIEAEADTLGRIRSGKLAGKSMWAAIWILAIPVLVQQTMQAFVGMVDKIIAGSLPDAIVVPALDGLGIGSYVGWFIGIAMTGLGIGGQAIIARSMGSGDLAQGDRALGQAMSLSIVWGVLVGVLMWFGSPALAALCQLTDEAARYCVEYIRTIAIAMPFAGLMLVGSMCLHGAGETLLPSIIAVVINVVNIFFSWMLSGVEIELHTLVISNPFDFNLHVIGIAAGTSISYLIGAMLILWVQVGGVKDLQLRASELPLDRLMTWRIIRVGVPNFCEGISMWMVNLFILMIIGVIAANSAAGEGLQGAHIIAVQWEAFSFMPGFAIGIAAGALAGQYLGAGNPAMAQRAVLTCTAIAGVIMTVLGVVFIFAGRWLTGLVSTQPVHLEHTPDLLAICGVMQIFFAITIVVRQGLRGVGDTKWTFIITTASSYLVRLPAAYLLGVTFGLGLHGIWIGLSGEFFVRAALFSARFFHGGWKRLQI